MKAAVIRLFATFSLLLLSSLAGVASTTDLPVNTLLCRLDSVIAQENEFTRAKLNRIADIKHSEKSVRTPEERYWYNRRLYDEFYVFDADSAMHYANENLALARQAGNTEWENEWKIKRSFLLSVMGLLKSSQDEIESIDRSTLSPRQMADYYTQWAYLYSHLGQVATDRNVEWKTYFDRSAIYEDSVHLALIAAGQEALHHRGAAVMGNPKLAINLVDSLNIALAASKLDTREDAINAYVLSRLYADRGDVDNQIRFLIISGIIDVMTSNRDIASLEELATLLVDRGDIDRAYNYINYCRRQALNLPNQVRAASLSRTESNVHQLYVDRLKTTGDRLKASLTVLAVVLLMLVVLTIMIINRSHKLKRSKHELSESNARLSANIDELSRLREDQEHTLQELKQANEQISHINMDLKEANYVKEECIGATFALCSSYIDRLEDFRKAVSRRVRSNSWKELREEVSEASHTSDELKTFFRSFDTLFLNIYPDFVKDFNELLRPEEQIIVKPGELNTELRIYALVRLGISDSVKIASLLHCSPQTVYNYRLRCRNKAIIPKESFAETVKSLGKYRG